MIIQTETQLVHAFFDWVSWMANSESLYSYLYHIPNEGKRTTYTGRNLVKAGLKKGVPDYHLPLPTNRWAGLYIEFKSESGRLSKHQIEWCTKLRYVGHQVVVCRSLTSAQYITEDHIAHAKLYLKARNEREIKSDPVPLWEFDFEAPSGSGLPGGVSVSGHDQQGIGREKTLDGVYKDSPRPRKTTIK